MTKFNKHKLKLPEIFTLPPKKYAFPGKLLLTSELGDRLYHEAISNLKRRKLEKFIELLIEIKIIEPTHYGCLFLLIQIFEFNRYDDEAISLLRIILIQSPNEELVIVKLAKLLTKKGNYYEASALLTRCVQINPSSFRYNMLLAGCYGNLGANSLSQIFALRAVNLQPIIYTKTKTEPYLKIAILTSIENVPILLESGFSVVMAGATNNFDKTLDPIYINSVFIYVDKNDILEKLNDDLPDVDLVYNSITDFDVSFKALNTAEKICNFMSKPIINPPRKCLEINRISLYKKFRENKLIIFPKIKKLRSSGRLCRDLIQNECAVDEFSMPVIARVAGYQGGKKMHLVKNLYSHDFSELDEEITKNLSELYLIQYVDVGEYKLPWLGKKFYQKYRAFLVNGELYPVHLFTSLNYNVHLSNSKYIMLQYPQFTDQEKAFCANPCNEIGEENWLELKKIMNSSGLDYCGVDFSLITNNNGERRIVIFEINAAMTNWVSKLPPGDHVQLAWKDITLAIHKMLCERANKAPWQFVIPTLDNIA